MKNASKQKATQDERLNSLSQRIAREGSLIVSFLVGIVLLVSLLTYSPQDPGFTTTGNGGQVANAVGQMGAWTADVLLHMFGYFAYIFPLALGVRIFALFRQNNAERQFSWSMAAIRCGGLALLAIGACTLATLHFSMPADYTWPAGGLIGAAMADVSMPVLAVLGSTLVFLALFLFGLTVSFEISWLHVVDRVGFWTLNGYTKAVEAWRAWQEQREEDRKVKEGLEKRKRAMDVRIEKDKKRAPPRIEPVFTAPVERSQRVEKERQGKLFKAEASGELPAISLLDEKKAASNKGYSTESLEAMSRLLELKLQDFGIDI
ncbi:MAG: DNA translocase FtsK 4TM domain-containing protein, partial [Gammaproteobacteria bacterium]|nr:DNA translocase FtsK 4TM domain-containing protein [Gammaproteobacteria bacterium]